MSAETFRVVCPGCACLCDDVEITIESDSQVEFSPHCPLGSHWFQTHLRPVQHCATIAGKEAAYEDAVERAAALLRASQYPLVFGLSRSSTPGQRAAIELGEKLGGVVDTTASLCHGPSIMALQEFGEVTCTLGEVRNRADLVIFWGCNPADSHPRHAERYSVNTRGKYLPEGRANRKVVLMGDSTQIDGWRIDQAGTKPDLVIPIEPGRDFEVLDLLTRALKEPGILEGGTGISELMELMRACSYGVVFFGLGLSEVGSWGGTRRTGTGHVNVGALLHLVAELNSKTRFTARRMRLQGDVSGADNVLLWQAGFPFAVDYSRGYPRYNPGEFTANELLERQDVDLVLFVGAETVPYLSSRGSQHLRDIPSVVLDYPGTPKNVAAAVSFTTAVYGIHAPGTAYRMDNVPLQLGSIQPSSLPTDERVLQDLSAALGETG